MVQLILVPIFQWVLSIIISLLFDSDNETIRELYMHQRMSDCHLEVYSVCQEGEIVVKKLTVDVDDGKSITMATETLQANS